MIEAQHLAKRFQDKKRGEVRAVDGVSFLCRPGEIYGLLGANGAGKTTTLRMLATILRPSQGNAIVAGHDVIKEPQAVRAHVGFLSTATALYGRLSAQEMVEYFGRLYGLDEPTLRRRIDGDLRAARNERFQRPPLRQAFNRHEAKSVDRAHTGTRSLGDDLR